MTEIPTGDHAIALRRLLDLNARITELAGEAESLKAELRVLPPGDYTLAGRPALRIQPQRKFDPQSGYALLDETAKHAALSVSIDAAKVKRQLTPDQLEACMVPSGQPKVISL
jgi:hypothetical protein